MDEKRFRPRKRTTNRPDNSEDFYNRDRPSYEQRPYNPDYNRGERQPRNYTNAGSYGNTGGYGRPQSNRTWQPENRQHGRSYDNRGGYGDRGGYGGDRGGYGGDRPRHEGHRGGYGYSGGQERRSNNSGYGGRQQGYQGRPQYGGRPGGQQRPGGHGRPRPGLGGKKRVKRHAITLVKALVRSHYASRQLALEYIQQGAVVLNDRIVKQPNTAVTLDRDHIAVTSLPSKAQTSKTLFFAVHKPKQMALLSKKNTSSYKFLTKDTKWYFPAGRLDKSSSGIIIVTNDPEFRNSEQSPLLSAPKEYRIKVHRAPLKKEFTVIEKDLGELVEEKSHKPKASLLRKNARHAWISIYVYEISSHDIRRVLKKNNLEILAFERYSIGGINIDLIPPGAWRRMDEKELFAGETMAAERKTSEKEKVADDEESTHDDKKTLWQQLYQQWFKHT